MENFRLAVRNLLRNRRRSLIALGTVVFGVVALLLAGGFIEWIFWALRESNVAVHFGHIQVARVGYFKAGAADPFRYLMPEDSPEERAIVSTPHVRALAPRLKFGGLVSFGDTTLSFLGEGVDPDAEKRINKYKVVRDGTDLAKTDTKGVILGNGLARNLGARVGDTIVLLATTSSGGINALEVRVRGLFVTATKAFDDSVLRMPIDTARQLLRTSGSHTWLLLLDDVQKTPAIVAELTRRFPRQASGLEFTPWFDLADFYNKTVKLFSRQMFVVELIIGGIIILTISNMAVMNVLERTSEIGTLMAIGLRRRKILRIFLYEGLILGIVGGACGALVGWGLSLLLSAIGIPMPPSPGMEEGFDAELIMTRTLAAKGVLLAIGATMLATIYPAWKASRLQIADALRRGK